MAVTGRLATGRVLDVIRRRQEAPGSLVRTGPTAAPWVYLLPRLRYDRVTILGYADRQLIEMLSRRAERTFSRLVDPLGRDDLLVINASRGSHLPVGRRQVARLVLSTVAGGGVAYVESIARPGTDQKDVPARLRAQYLIAPHRGRATSLAPVGSPALAEWLGNRGLIVTHGTTRWAVETAQRVRAIGRASLGRSSRTSTTPRAAATRAGGHGRRLARRVAGGAIGTLVRAESLYDRITRLERRASIWGTPPGTPTWLSDLAREAGVDLVAHEAAVAAPGEYPTQKILVPLLRDGEREPTIIVKVGDHPAIAPRVRAAVDAMNLLSTRRLVAPGTVPQVLFSGAVHGVQVMAEGTAPGLRFNQVTTGRVDCRWGMAVIDWIIDLGRATRRRSAAEPVVEALGEVVDRLRALSDLDASEHAFLRSMLGEVRAARGLPVVVQHGDPGPWNIHVDADRGLITVLDWENAEPTGMPLWDLSYFLRSFGSLVARHDGVVDRLDRGLYAITHPSMRLLAMDAIHRYVARVGLPPSLVRPLYYHHWAYQALKESTRLHASQSHHGIFMRTLRWLIDHRDDPTVDALLDIGS